MSAFFFYKYTTCFTREEKMEKSTIATPSFRRLSPVVCFHGQMRGVVLSM